MFPSVSLTGRTPCPEKLSHFRHYAFCHLGVPTYGEMFYFEGDVYSFSIGTNPVFFIRQIK